DTRAILMGSMAGAEALGKGIAAAGQSLAEGMELGRQRKVARKGTETKIQALMKLHEGNEAMTSRLAPLLNTLQSDEVRGSEKDAIVSQIDPLVNAITAKQAQDVATAERNLTNTYRAAQLGLQERQVDIAEGQAAADMLGAQAQLQAAQGKGSFAEQEFTKEMIPDVAKFLSGGRARARQNIETLNEVLEKLSTVSGKPELNTGAFVGSVPKRFAAELKLVEDQVGGIVNESLRQILGAQFTQQEGERILGQSFDPTAPNEQNIARVERLRDELVSRFNAQNRYANQLQQTDRIFPDVMRGMTEETSSRGNILIGEDGRIVIGDGSTSQSAAPKRTGPGSALGELIEQEEQEAKGTNRAPAPAPAPPMGQGPGDSPETPVPNVKVEGRVPGPPASRLQQSRVQRALEQQEASLEDAAQAVPVPAEPIPEEIDTSGAGVAEPTTKAVALSGPASSAVALSNKIEGAALPKYSAKLAESLVYDESATLRQPVAFAPGPAERKKLRAAGNVLLNLDANHSGFKTGTKTPKRRVLEPMMVIPDDAKPETQTAAALAIGLMDNLYEQVHGKEPSKSVEERLLTKSQ
ncbi:hypothetical protein, partial [uncultured Limnobacter sp.]|uniref:hypothetical protein n=1 Tax=uncultured Limnobacter sp. TaxID=199681 RepID=UPI0032B2BD96